MIQRNTSAINTTCDFGVSDATTIGTVLVFLPDPGVKNLIEEDKETMNATSFCAIRKTEPAGFESFFIAKFSPKCGQLSRCSVSKKTDINWSSYNFTHLEIDVEISRHSANVQINLATIIKLTKDSLLPITSKVHI
ncbi:unnamed protein product [Lymnaea stagnalis]|uniref:Uncharacterized protein n=1 Tax=Lymnaea stagnalis TaxID=6523 RepID=A0AAV2H1E1_LYMST